MEQAPKTELRPKSPEVAELSFEQEIDLATALVEAQKRKVSLPHDIEEKTNQIFSGSSLTAEYSDEDISALRKADEAFAYALQEFDEKIPNREAFMVQIENAGKKDLSRDLARIFDVHKDNIIQRIIRKIAV